MSEAKPKPKTDDTSKELVKLRKTLERVNSAKYRFFLGVVGGIGTALGATVIVAILFAVLSKIFAAIGLGETIISSEIQKVLQ